MEYPLVSTAWLEANLLQPDVIVLDASMDAILGKEPRLYDEPMNIPKARKFSLEKVFYDKESLQPNMMPTVTQFNQAATEIGIDNESIVVIYDNQGIYSAPRAWWMFKLMGHDRVYVLDGGLPQWLLEQRMTVSTHDTPPSVDLSEHRYVGDYQGQLVYDASEVLTRLAAPDSFIIDARGPQRFSGQNEEPRPNIRSGHIPGSVNLPFAQVLDGYKLKTAAQLKPLFAAIDNGEDDKLRIFTCGSGITACILILASVAAGHDYAVLYDGSWAEWGSNPKFPVV